MTHMSSFRFLLAISLGVVALAAAAIGFSPALRAEEGLTETQKREVEEVIRSYLNENPEVLLDAIDALRAKQDAQRAAKAQAGIVALNERIEGDPSIPVGGNPAGSVTLVEFFDYQCGYCKRVFPAVRELVATDDDVRLVYLEFPILGEASVLAARAALGIWLAMPEKYMAFHEALMESRGQLTPERIVETAAAIGVAEADLETAMNDPAVEEQIRRNHSIAGTMGINGTPAFVIGDQLVPGAIDLATMRDLVEQYRDG